MLERFASECTLQWRCVACAPPADRLSDREMIYRLRCSRAEAALVVSHGLAVIEESMTLLDLARKIEAGWPLITPAKGDQ